MSETKKETQKNDKAAEKAVPKNTFKTIRHDESGLVAHLSAPDRLVVERVLGLVMPTNGEPRYITAGEYVLLNCWLDGDTEVKVDTHPLFMWFAMQAFQALTPVLSGIKKN